MPRKKYGHYVEERSVIEVIKIKRRTRKGAERPTSFRRIAAELNGEGYRTQSGRRWYGLMVKIVLERENGAAGRKKPGRAAKTELGVNDYLTAAEVDACRRAADAHEYPIFETLLGSGLRASELCALEIRDLGLTAGKSQIDVCRGKGAKFRTVGIGGRLRRFLVWYVEHVRPAAGPSEPVFLNRKGRRLAYQNLYYAIKCVRRKSGVRHLHPHSLRHTFGMFLYNYRNNIEHVKKQLGHASIATTEIYAKAFDGNKKEEMAGFERSLGIGGGGPGVVENTSKLLWET